MTDGIGKTQWDTIDENDLHDLWPIHQKPNKFLSHELVSFIRVDRGGGVVSFTYDG